ncbi:hypothetical protein EV189_3231 [Motilibacter rhizosphaerae]|uniref:Carboxypeptidase family protein n=1 Tax=Motilibacter rhizosphaerae TaxID=598652 RepID=A0A4Q7NHB0_9ACTN|nr:hypothetical protein EV189_3231 [Motilibacter rhizosphaerae]
MHLIDGTITFRLRDEPHQRATVVSTSAGRFTTELPAGEYEVTGVSPGMNDARNPCTPADPIVALVAKETREVDVDCQVP